MPSPSLPYSLGIDVGVTNIKSACVTPSGTILHQSTTETRADLPDWPHRVRDLVERIESEHGPATSLGLAAPGLAAPDGTQIAWMQGRLDAVQGLNWTDLLQRAHPVPVLNDAQAALLGEAWIGAAAGSRNVGLLTLGTGVGGALLVDGHLLRGHIGRAGHLGHISLGVDADRDIVNTPGSLEHFVGNATIRARTGGRFGSTHDLIAAHQAGDPDATRVWLRSVRHLAAGIASIVNVADPEVVVIGGGIARAGDALFRPLADLLAEFEWRPHHHQVRVTPAALGEFAGAIGAAKNAINERATDAHG